MFEHMHFIALLSCNHMIKILIQKYTRYRPQTKLRKGNVFTPVCQSFCSQGVYPSACWDMPPPGQTPPLGCPLADTPPGQTPQADNPLGTTPLGKHPTSRRLLLQTVRILLECILVLRSVRTKLYYRDVTNMLLLERFSAVSEGDNCGYYLCNGHINMTETSDRDMERLAIGTTTPCMNFTNFCLK